MAASEEVPAPAAAGVEDTEENEKDPPLYSLTFNSATSAKSSIAWSYDDRLAVITDSCIYIIKIVSSNTRKKPGATWGWEIESSYIPNISHRPHDVGMTSKMFLDNR